MRSYYEHTQTHTHTCAQYRSECYSERFARGSEFFDPSVTKKLSPFGRSAVRVRRPAGRQMSRRGRCGPRGARAFPSPTPPSAHGRDDDDDNNNNNIIIVLLILFHKWNRTEKQNETCAGNRLVSRESWYAHTRASDLPVFARTRMSAAALHTSM